LFTAANFFYFSWFSGVSVMVSMEEQGTS